MRNKKQLLACVLAVSLLPAAARAGHVRDDRRAPASEYSRSGERGQLGRIRAIMLPLVQVTDHRRDDQEIDITIVDDPAVNAASAGSGKFLVTTGLLQSATDNQLRGVLAHEIAHEDLGHPARAQIIGAGMNIGVALLEKIFPGSSSFTPLAGSLITSRYTRPLELDADRHAVTLLRRAGYSKQTMLDTLMWLRSRTGNGGGLFSSHPATSERLQALRALR